MCFASALFAGSIVNARVLEIRLSRVMRLGFSPRTHRTHDKLAARLRVMPAVVLTGAPQAGKSALVEQLVPGERRYRSLDDFDVRDATPRPCWEATIRSRSTRSSASRAC